MALFRPELWVQSGYPGDYTCTFKVAAYVESDPGAVTQVIISRNWNAANEGIVLYYDNTADQMSVVWFTGGGSTFEQAVLASRPALNEPFIAYLQSSSSTVKGGYALLSSPTTWVSNQTANPLPAHGTDNAINLTSNANGAYITAQNWCGWNELLSEATLSGEIYSRAVYRTNLVFEHKLNDGDVTSPWPDSSGNANDATQQGGLAPTNRANFLPDPPSAFTPETVKLRARQGRHARTARTLLDVRDWAPPTLRVERWFAEELRAASAAGSHATTGALSAAASTISGSAAHFTLHATSGALASQAAALSGTATHLTLHATTGALAAQAATISGAAAHQHATAGALSAQAATIAGAASHATLHTTSGALSSQAAGITGAAQHQHATSGALSAQSATIAGSADHTAAGASHATSGALAADAATISGSAAHLTLHTTTGTLSAQSATISGAAVHPHTTSGALVSQAAVLSGAAQHLTLHAASGVLSAQSASIGGTAERSVANTHASSGSLAAADATVVGVATRSGGAPGPGFFNEGSGLPSAKPQPRKHRVKAPKPKQIERVSVVHEAYGALVAGNALIESDASLTALVRQRGLLRTKEVPPYPKLMRDSCPHCGAPAAHNHQ